MGILILSFSLSNQSFNYLGCVSWALTGKHHLLIIKLGEQNFIVYIKVTIPTTYSDKRVKLTTGLIDKYCYLFMAEGIVMEHGMILLEFQYLLDTISVILPRNLTIVGNNLVQVSTLNGTIYVQYIQVRVTDIQATGNANSCGKGLNKNCDATKYTPTLYLNYLDMMLSKNIGRENLDLL